MRARAREKRRRELGTRENIFRESEIMMLNNNDAKIRGFDRSYDPNTRMFFFSFFFSYVQLFAIVRKNALAEIPSRHLTFLKSTKKRYFPLCREYLAKLRHFLFDL